MSLRLFYYKFNHRFSFLLVSIYPIGKFHLADREIETEMG